MQEPGKRIIAKRDTNSINKLCRELDIVCSLINKAIDKLNEECLLTVEINDALIRHLNFCDSAIVTKALQEAYEAESEKFKLPIARKDFAENAQKSINRTNEIFTELKEKIGIECSKNVCFNDPYLRSDFIFASNGKAEYNKEAILEYYTVYADGEVAKEYVKKAREIHRMLVDFDRQTLLLSRGNTRGITDDLEEEAGIIEVVDGIIWLDLSRLENLDFANAEQLLNTNKIYNKSKIVEVKI